MPIVDGFSVLHVIRSSEKPKLAAIPIIVLTTLAMKDSWANRLSAGAAEIWPGP